MTCELTDLVLGSEALTSENKELLLAIKELFAGAGGAHIEDYLSELVDLLAIAERRSERKAERKTVPVGGKEYTCEQLRASIDQIKNAIVGIIDASISIDTHRAFISAVHRPTRVGKETPNRVDYIVLNYDTAIEDALALERIGSTDGIVGGVTGLVRSWRRSPAITSA